MDSLVHTLQEQLKQNPSNELIQKVLSHITAASLNNEVDESEEWEIEEVGRGLANYNSAQIARVKGMKRCGCERLGSDYLYSSRPYSSFIAQNFGYADSEYVVENITVRIPP